jgi:hypothetical protein
MSTDASVLLKEDHKDPRAVPEVPGRRPERRKAEQKIVDSCSRR